MKQMVKQRSSGDSSKVTIVELGPVTTSAVNGTEGQIRFTLPANSKLRFVSIRHSANTAPNVPVRNSIMPSNLVAGGFLQEFTRQLVPRKYASSSGAFHKAVNWIGSLEFPKDREYAVLGTFLNNTGATLVMRGRVFVEVHG